MKKRNQFDSKDMILLVVTLLIIYVVMSWFGNFGDLIGSGNQTSIESQTYDNEGQ